MKKLLNIHQVCELVHLSRVTIWRLCRENKFPQPLHTSEKNRAWRLDEIEQWIDERSEARTQEAA